MGGERADFRAPDLPVLLAELGPDRAGKMAMRDRLARFPRKDRGVMRGIEDRAARKPRRARKLGHVERRAVDGVEAFDWRAVDLEHHVAAGWSFSYIHLLSWAGMLLVGFLAWMPLGWISVSFAFGLSVAIGWSAGYFYYEYVHAMAHLAAPTSRYQRWLRKHHFHHHFGHPMSNHGVTVAWWDRVFGTLEVPDRVRVPRRMAQPWMLDEDGELRPEHADDYVLVGAADRTERLAQLDRAKAFASIAPDD